jgi:molecular chaperone Hsp33
MTDEIIRGNSMGGEIRVFAAVTTHTVNEARRIHKSFPVASAALGRALTAAAIMGTDLKNPDDTTTIQFKGDGPLGMVVAVTDSKSHVRGYVQNPFVDLPLNDKGKLDVGGGVGKGLLSVIRDLGMKEPYIGQVPLQTGEIAEDLTYYYAVSEQIPTAMALGVLVDTDGSVKCAGGYLIQIMPEAGEKDIERVEQIIADLPSVTTMIDGGADARGLFARVTEGFDMVIDNKPIVPDYKCTCSRERMERALVSIGKKEIEDIIREQGEAELTCQFCDNRYVFDKARLTELAGRAK